MRYRFRTRIRRAVLLLLAIAALGLGGARVARAEFQWWSNLVVTGWISVPMFNQKSGGWERQLFVMVTNRGWRPTVATTTRVAIRTEDMFQRVQIDSTFDVPTPTLGHDESYGFGVLIPDAARIRCDIWADAGEIEQESSEWDNHLVLVSAPRAQPEPINPPPFR